LSPSWSADGKHVTYTQYQKRLKRTKASKGRKSRKQWEMIPVLKKHNLLTGKRLIISERRGMNSGASWSPDGSKIAVTLSYTGRPEIYFIDPKGVGKAQSISRKVKIRRIAGDGFQPNYASLLFDVEPDFSPDGTQLVYSSARTGHPMIYVVELATMIGKQLTFAGTYNSSPVWSPKGDKIIFAAQRIGKGNFDLYSIEPDGNNLSRLTKGGRNGRRRINNENASWAPTGRHFAFSTNESGKYEIYVRTMDGSVRRRISPPNQECTDPAWGPAEG